MALFSCETVNTGQFFFCEIKVVKFVLDLGIIIERQNCLTFKETVSSVASSFDRMARLTLFQFQLAVQI